MSITTTDLYTASCSDCEWTYSTGEHMIRDHEAKWHRCYKVVTQ